MSKPAPFPAQTGPIQVEFRPASPWGMESVETPLAPLIRNAEATLVELRCGAVVVPMIIPDRSLKVDPRERCSVTCMESASVGYVLDEWRRLNQPTRLMRMAANAIGAVSSCGPWRRAVQLGSLPFTTTLRSPEMEDAVWKILPELRERMPDRPFIVRGILDDKFPERLPEDGVKLPVWVDYRWDFSKGETPRSSHFKRDQNQFRRSGLIVIEDEDFDESRVAEALHLYGLLYRHRHSLRNPDYSPEFIAMSRARGWLRLCGLVDPHSGRLLAFADRQATHGVSTDLLIGYDTTMDQKARLYRHLTAMLAEAALHRRLSLNLLSGAGEFKRLRGYLPVLERLVAFPALRGPRRWSDRMILDLTEKCTRKFNVESMIAAGG